jgi:hypothetical protein
MSNERTAYLLLWSVMDLPSLNKAYAVNEFLPGVTRIGSDGGDTGDGFRWTDGRAEYVSVPLVAKGPAH